MQDLANLHAIASAGLGNTSGRKASNTDDPRRLQDRDGRAKMHVTGSEERTSLGGRQLIGCAVAAGAFEERERAIVEDDVVLKELLCCPKTLREKSPEPFPADLRARAGKTLNDPSRMFVVRLEDGTLYPKPIANGGDFAKRNAGLRHSERSRIHPDKHDVPWGGPKGAQVLFVRRPRVTQRVVNVSHRGGEFDPLDCLSQAQCGFHQRFRYVPILRC